MPRQYYVYILANRSRTLYVGVTGNIHRRLQQHRAGVASSFTNRYLVRRLVYVDSSSLARDAIAREKQIKGWSRSKKVALIESVNPEWLDLAASWFEPTHPKSKAKDPRRPDSLCHSEPSGEESSGS